MKRFFSTLLLMSLGALVLVGCGEAATATTAPATTALATVTAAQAATTASGAVTPNNATTVTGNPTTANSATTAAGGATTVAATGTTTTTGATTAAANTAGIAANLGIPIYSGLKPLNLGTAFEQALAQGMTGQSGANAKFGVFSTSDSVSKVLDYYDAEMKKAGFTKGTTQDIPSQVGITLTGKIAGYQKGTGSDATAAVVVAFGPLDANLITIFTSQAPAPTPQLKAGDSVVMLFNNLSGRPIDLPLPTPDNSINTGTSTLPAPGATPTK